MPWYGDIEQPTALPANIGSATLDITARRNHNVNQNTIKVSAAFISLVGASPITLIKREGCRNWERRWPRKRGRDNDRTCGRRTLGLQY
jgi:hypothetical protein